MYATEFQTIINEPYIRIPNYEEFKGHTVRVVLLNLDNDTSNIKADNEEGFFDRITKNPKNIKDITFLSREEANAR